MPHPPFVLTRLLNQRVRLRVPSPMPEPPLSPQSYEGDSSDGYDTDLDYEDEIKNKAQTLDSKKKIDKGIGLIAYEKVCMRTAVSLQSGIACGLIASQVKMAERQLGPANLTGLACALLSNSTVKLLDLSSNSLGFDGGKEVIAVLFTNRTVSELNLSNNKLGGNGVSALLSKLLSTNRTIVEMNLSHNGFTDDDAKYLASGIERNDRVLAMDLSHNEFREVGAEALGKAIASNDTITDMNLSWNHIRKKGAVNLGTSLKRNWVLKKLDLSWNGLAYEGALAAREALRANKYLSEVNISSNRINWEGALLLAEALESNSTLNILRAGNNPLTTTGCLDIIDSLSRNEACALILLDIMGVPVVRDFEFMAKSISQLRPEFKVIHGGVVQLHDVLGQRTDRKIHPMQKILNYMYQNEMRPVELMRGFDKDVKFQLTFNEFVDKLRAVGIDIKSWEEDELKDYIMSSGMSSQRIDYKMLIDSVAAQIEKERNHRIAQRDKTLRTSNFQLQVLNNASHSLPPLNIDQVVSEVTGVKMPADDGSPLLARKIVSDSVNHRSSNTFEAKMALAKNIKRVDVSSHVTPRPVSRARRAATARSSIATLPMSNGERLWMSSSLSQVQVRSTVDASIVKRRRPKSMIEHHVAHDC